MFNNIIEMGQKVLDFFSMVGHWFTEAFDRIKLFFSWIGNTFDFFRSGVISQLTILTPIIAVLGLLFAICIIVRILELI